MIRTESADETRAIGERLGRAALAGDVILLDGDLGAGKTTLTQGIGAALGIDEVSSPTFVLVADHPGRLTLYHVDLYRLGEIDDLRDLGLDDVLGIEGLTVVEWPARYVGAWPDALRIHITAVEDRRTLTLTATGPRGDRLLRAIDAACD